MTEKRFICESYGFYDTYKENRWLWSEYKEIEKIMNNLDLKARERSKALSKLQRENEDIKQTIRESYKTERTEMGKSVLMQLAENLEVKL